MNFSPFIWQCTNCGNKMAIRAKNCNSCGESSRSSYVRCGTCRQWVGADSEFCHGCQHQLYPQFRNALQKNDMRLLPGYFANRIPIRDHQGYFDKHRFFVEHGTCGLVLSSGKFNDVILLPDEQGYDLASTTPNRVDRNDIVYLIRTGEFVLRVEVDGLRSRDHVPLQLIGCFEFRFRLEHAGKLLDYLMDKHHILIQELSELVRDPLTNIMISLCREYSIEELVFDINAREKINNHAWETVVDAAVTHGIELCRVSRIDFGGDEFERICDKLGQLEIKRRAIDFEQNWQQLIRTHELQEFKDRKAFESLRKHVALEYEIDDQRSRQELETEMHALQHEMEMKHLETENGRKIAGMKADYERDRQLLDYRTQLESRRIELESELTGKKISIEEQEAISRALSRIEIELTELAGQNLIDMEDLKGRKERCIEELEYDLRIIRLQRAVNELDGEIEVGHAQLQKKINSIKTSSEIEDTIGWLGVRDEKNKIDHLEKQRELKRKELKKEIKARRRRKNEIHAAMIRRTDAETRVFEEKSASENRIREKESDAVRKDQDSNKIISVLPAAATSRFNKNRKPEPGILHIEEGHTGIDYESLLYPYLKNARNIQISQPHLQENYQFNLFYRFVEILIPAAEPITIMLRVKRAEKDWQRELQDKEFPAIIAKVAEDNINLTIDIEDGKAIHDRWITADTGWNITLGRGLDIFREPKFSYEWAALRQRQCKETRIEFSRVDMDRPSGMNSE